MDSPELEFHLHHPLMKRIVELKERNFEDKDKYDDAPVDHEDAIENYKQLLEITGDITANVIEPNSESVDEEGPHLVDGRMVYASKTFENLDATRKAGLWGISMPRRYGGLNLPITPYFDGIRDDGDGRCWFPKHLELARLYRNAIRIR